MTTKYGRLSKANTKNKLVVTVHTFQYDHKHYGDSAHLVTPNELTLKIGDKIVHSFFTDKQLLTIEANPDYKP